MNEKDNNEIINLMLDMEYIPSAQSEKININQYTKFPISEISTLGVGFSSLYEATRTVTQTINADGLYKCILPQGAAKLAQAKDGTGALGTALGSNNKLVGQARWIKQDNVTQVTTIPYNPTMLFMAVALMSMDFHQNQISNKLKKQSFLHSDQNVKSRIRKIYSEFKNYQLALYIYSFASFIEVILLGNFNSEYLNSICQQIEDLSLKYRELYTECYNYMEGYASTSMQSHLLNGLATVSKMSGNLIGKVPVVGKSPIDEVLIETGGRLEKLESNKTNKTLKNIVDARSSEVRLFVDNINRLNKLYNEPLEFLIDKEYIYIRI